ncbi:polygalacturonase [Panicum miliaceum]|uniref:Polygalacturonase n=1 Tax=Panicum miliaceum TaxID=4540 RepID=A0A3L6SKY0_PANMI|nr:polygalacturonase [Panicum miliaceum]
MPPPPPPSSMRPPVTHTRPQLRPRPVPLVTTVLISVLVFISVLCHPVAADASRALRYHRKHRRHHNRHHRAENSGGHIALPPAPALPPDVDGDSPAEPPGLPPDAGDAPAPRRRHHKPCCPPSHPPLSVAPAGAPAPAPAKPPAAFSSAKPTDAFPCQAAVVASGKATNIPLAKATVARASQSTVVVTLACQTDTLQSD